MKTKTLAAAILTAALAGPAAAQDYQGQINGLTLALVDMNSNMSWLIEDAENMRSRLNTVQRETDSLGFYVESNAHDIRSAQQQAIEAQRQAHAAREFAARGTAIALASTVAMPALSSGETGFAVGAGAYDGYGALAFNVAHQRGATLYSAGVSTTDDGRTGVRAGAAWKW